jgi:hypothetical protein
MTDRLKINGWMVAEADLEHGYDPYNAFDRLGVFRNPASWSTLTIARDVRYDDSERPISGTVTVTTSEFATLDELAGHIEKGYRAGAWVQLLDAGHDNDPDLYAAWVPSRCAATSTGPASTTATWPTPRATSTPTSSAPPAEPSPTGSPTPSPPWPPTSKNKAGKCSTPTSSR